MKNPLDGAAAEQGHEVAARGSSGVYQVGGWVGDGAGHAGLPETAALGARAPSAVQG